MKFLLVLVLCLTPILSSAQQNSYSVYSAKKELLGKLKVNRTKTDSITLIEVDSEIKVKMLISVVISYSLSSIYFSDKLYSSSVITYRNKRLYSIMQTVRQNKQFKFTKDGDQINYIKDIDFVESMLYFKEPKGISFAYSEFDGVHKAISEYKSGHYKLTNPLNGNVSEYVYEKGVLESAQVQHPLMRIFVFRDKN